MRSFVVPNFVLLVLAAVQALYGLWQRGDVRCEVTAIHSRSIGQIEHHLPQCVAIEWLT